MELKFKETEFGTEIIGLDKELRQVGREGLLEMEIERLRARIVELEAENKRLRKAHNAVIDLINSSQGVYSLHLNGDGAPWETLRTGGQFEEWLLDFDEAALRREG